MPSTSSPEQTVSYDEDYVLWTEEQADMLMKGIFSALDIVNLVDEIQDLARRYHHSLEHRLTVVLTHLLKCLMQPGRKSASGSAVLLEQRKRIARLLKKNPSLVPFVGEYAADNYLLAVAWASAHTHLPPSRFPAENPFTVEQILDTSYEPWRCIKSPGGVPLIMHLPGGDHAIDIQL